MDATKSHTDLVVGAKGPDDCSQSGVQHSRHADKSQSAKISPPTIPASLDDGEARRAATSASRRTHTCGNSSRARGRIDNSVLCPRPFEAIYAEQAYLSLSLQWHAGRITRLIERYCQVERDSLTSKDAKRNRRQNRKLMHLLGCQVNYAVKQEQALFVRLSELHLECQSRDIWSRTRHRLLQETSNHNPYAYRPRRTSQLNGASPEFIPRAATPTVSETISHDTANEDSLGDELGNHGLEFEFESTKDEDAIPTCRLSGERVSKASKRLSLPNIQFIWPT